MIVPLLAGAAKTMVVSMLSECSNEAMMKITASIDANTKSMDSLITDIERKRLG